MSFELLRLDCPTCGSGVRAAGGDVVYYCVSCRNGYRLDTAGRGLEPLEVAFVAAPHVAAERYLPFWHLPARIEILRRSGSGAGRLLNAFSSFFAGSSGPGGGEGDGDAAFVVPAFAAPLDGVVELTRRYSRDLPALGERLGERLLGGCYGVADARKLAHFALIAAEVEKPDTLKRLDYELAFGPARLLGVPFARAAGHWRDALHGIDGPPVDG